MAGMGKAPPLYLTSSIYFERRLKQVRVGEICSFGARKLEVEEVDINGSFFGVVFDEDPSKVHANQVKELV